MFKKKQLSVEIALSRIASLCARCEQCSPDIEKKLHNWGITEKDAKFIIDTLKQKRFIDDVRYAKAYAHDKLCFSGWGKRKIEQGLWVKRLNREVIEVAFDEIEEGEYLEVAEKVIRSKISSIKEGTNSYEGRMKLARFASQRGFELDIIRKIINRLRKEETDD
ncbi:MAG: RecX family transcriptional regulator [Muribaculum sp.]|nr:RecX family transcriptional regulator [Muribaculum sp.]